MAKPRRWRQIATERIKVLMDRASELSFEDRILADRYVFHATRLAAKYKVRLPDFFRFRICRNCKRYLYPGKNARIRTRSGYLIIYCFECRRYRKLKLCSPKLTD